MQRNSFFFVVVMIWKDTFKNSWKQFGNLTLRLYYTCKSHRISKFVGLLHFNILLHVVAGLTNSVVLSFGCCMLKTVVLVTSRGSSVITF